MQLRDLLDTELLERHIEARLVNRQRHPTLPLNILNYSAECTFGNHWDDVTRKTRGLIYADSGEVIARPFEKFFNLNDERHPETCEANLPKSLPIVTEKMDGSLGIYYSYEDQFGIATRGSFTSHQAIWATEWIKKQDWRIEASGHTYLFEVIFNENRIVVRYPFEGLVLLAIVEIETGNEVPRSSIETIWSWKPLVAQFSKTIQECATDQRENEEGYVLHWPAERLRVKVKFTEYLRLHRLLTGISPKTIWEMLRAGESLEPLLKDTPDEFVEWLEKWEVKFHTEFCSIIQEAIEYMKTGAPSHEGNEREHRKRFAAASTSSRVYPAYWKAAKDFLFPSGCRRS